MYISQSCPISSLEAQSLSHLNHLIHLETHCKPDPCNEFPVFKFLPCYHCRDPVFITWIYLLVPCSTLYGIAHSICTPLFGNGVCNGAIYTTLMDPIKKCEIQVKSTKNPCNSKIVKKNFGPNPKPEIYWTTSEIFSFQSCKI